MIRGFIFGILVAAVGSCVHHQSHMPPTDYEFACDAVSEVIGVEACAGLNEPEVIITDIVGMGMRGALGLHVRGEQYVFVDPDAPNHQHVIRHELIHYILFNNGILDRCLGEELARRLTGNNDPWRLSYRCPIK